MYALAWRVSIAVPGWNGDLTTIADYLFGGMRPRGLLSAPRSFKLSGLQSQSVDDQRCAPIERPRRFLRVVVLEALLAKAGDRQPRRRDPALDQIVPNRSRAPLAERLVVRRTPLRTRIALDVQAHRGIVVQRLQRHGQRTQRVGPKLGAIAAELNVGQHAQRHDF